MVPLPDADPDKRMYKLLKNIDLENLSFADFQSTAQTVFAEPEAEDTLRRIVLINLARMSVAGDWNGLTTSGGGGGYNLAVGPWTSADGVMNSFSPAATYARDLDIESFALGLFLIPFLAPSADTVDAFSIHSYDTVTTGPFAGIYSSNDDGTPDALQVSCQFSTSSGLETQTTLSGSLTFTAGDLYYLAFIQSGLAQRFYTVNTGGEGASVSVFPQEDPTTGGDLGKNLLVWFDAGLTAFPATITVENFSLVSSDFPVIQYRVS